MRNNHKRKYPLYDINEVLNHYRPPRGEDKRPVRIEVNFDGDWMKMGSPRYELFKEKGVVCVHCGIEGRFFAKEKDCNADRYHFNLYALTTEGEEILMTKDHIIPKSRGGKNNLRNYQTMCETCNRKKNNQYEHDLIKAGGRY